MEIKLIVRNIIGADINGYSRVTVSNELFNAVRGVRPALAYKGQGDSANNGVRVFNVGGVDLYAHYDKESRKTVFLMKTEEANKHLMSLEQERANEPKLEFDVKAFNVVETV